MASRGSCTVARPGSEFGRSRAGSSVIGPGRPRWHTNGTRSGRGELLGLRWQDVDIADRVLQVRQELQRVDGRLQLVGLKTRKSRPALPMPRFVVKALAAHQVAQQREGLSI